ncbi:uncharacterized protein LOC100832997 isoform X2 [Brachypodium distachyon]|nr:uncharacterized protein LOC100832997 isoform X2 [Brachypodium distachyon]KQJ92494.1 hypothetical protein BRADI_4g44060v3 [Brachypodium distachyon]PNT65535.1 hypothetical protein BRADI_4g44060v3 [Brachypodium distachyon]|eukprot:XP_014757464.1 uncharacterized protein LOC100832997 isoform X2 [Brachypodium distachyon]
MSLCRMRRNGFSLQICESFLIGFPSWWESWDSHFESQPTSSSNSQEDSSQIYLKIFQLGNVVQKSVASFIKNPLHDAKIFRRYVADAFTQCSRFDEYSFDNDTSTKGKTVASNDASEGPAAVANEVDNMEIDLIVSSTSQERGHVDISCNASFAPTEKCTSDETYKEAENQNDSMHPDVTEQEAGNHSVNSDLICNRSRDRMPSDLEDGNTNAGNSTDVALCHLATAQPERVNCCSEIPGALQNIQPLSNQRNPVASLKNQSHPKRTEDISLNQKAVPIEDTSTSIRSHVLSSEKTVGPSKKQRSAQDKLLSPARLRGTRNPISYVHHSPHTRGKAQSLSISTPESLEMTRTKSGRVVVPPLDLGCERILYGNNHLVLGVAPVKLHSPPIKGSKPETPARKRRAR